MNRSFQKRIAHAGGTVLLMLLCGCVAPGDGYVGGSVSYGVDYYEPYGYDYGVWGPGYFVGPPHGGHRRIEVQHGRPYRHTYRPAPPSHRMPSIPTHPRSPRIQRPRSH